MNLTRELDASYLLKKDSQKDSGYLIGEIEIRPEEQACMLLGVFNNISPPLGFTIFPTLSSLDDTIITQITRLEIDNHTYKLNLHIANYGDRTVSMEIRQLKM